MAKGSYKIPILLALLVLAVLGVIIFVFTSLSQRETITEAIPPIKEGTDIAPESFKPIQPQRITNLNLRLLGTLLGEGIEPKAFIEDLDTGTKGLYKIKDTIKGAEIIAIVRESATLKIGDEEIVLRIGSASAGGGAYPSQEQWIKQMESLEQKQRKEQELMKKVRERLTEEREKWKKLGPERGGWKGGQRRQQIEREMRPVPHPGEGISPGSSKY